jgi:hypothetical protein
LRVAPWKHVSDSQVIRVDIPALDVHGACLSIIGGLGETLGFLLFPSLAAFDRFYATATRKKQPRGPIDLGTTILSLNFERGAELPASMRREVAEHGWPVAASNAYPRVEHRDRDGLQRPVSERDIQIAAATATSLTAFFAKHGELLEDESFEPICESWRDENDLEVCFTVPAQAAALFEANDLPRTKPARSKFDPKIGRNAPCPCGSGQKYKKCCLAKDETAYGASDTPAPRAARARGERRIMGPAAQLMEFAQPLIDAANGEAALNRALSMASACWNLALCKDEGSRERLLSHLLEVLPKDEKTRADFRSIAASHGRASPRDVSRAASRTVSA